MASGKGWFFYTLNVLRIISILAMVYSIIAGLCCVVKMYQTSSFSFFTFANTILVILFLIIFIMIELGFFKNYLVRNWPAFSSTSTFIGLACGQVIAGFQILEVITRSHYKRSVVGGAVYGLALSAGCLLVTVGWLYIIISIWSSIHYNELYIKAIRSCGSASAGSYTTNPDLPVGASCTSYRTGSPSVYAPSALSAHCRARNQDHQNQKHSHHTYTHANASRLNYSSSTRSSARSNRSRYTYEASSQVSRRTPVPVLNPAEPSVEYMNSMSMLGNIIHDTPSRGLDNVMSTTGTAATVVVAPPPFLIRKVDVDEDEDRDERERRRRGGGGSSSVYSVPSYYTNLTDVDLRSPTIEIQKPIGLYRSPSSRRI